MKKVLFIRQSYLGLENQVIRLIEDVLGYNVTYVDPLKFKYKYRNLGERFLNNVVLRPINMDIKDSRYEKSFLEFCKTFGEFDYLFVINPNCLPDSVLSYLKGKCKKTVAHFWDSLSTIPELRSKISCFDSCFSYDLYDAKQNGLEFLPNFYDDTYIKPSKDNSHLEYLLYTSMSYDKRFPALEKIAKNLRERGIPYKFLVYSKIDIESEYVTIISQPISQEENYKLLLNSRCILELGQPGEAGRGGVSFRAIECLGFKRKLITTYRVIESFDFYNPANISVIDYENPTIEEDFIFSDYLNVPNDVVENYSATRWIERIFK